MREIKFRAWDGNQMILPRDKAYYQHYLSFCGQIVQKSSEGMDCFGGGDRWSRRDKVELMQFTGLQDNNGVDIYEGDIVKCINGHVGVIEWEKSDCCFNVDGYYDGGNDYPSMAFMEGQPFTVIGNIYENPELLK